jgi:hypothetical protein
MMSERNSAGLGWKPVKAEKQRKVVGIFGNLSVDIVRLGEYIPLSYRKSGTVVGFTHLTPKG